MTFTGIKRQIVIGARIRCIENTYRPEINGRMRTVTKVQTNGFYCRVDGLDGDRFWTAHAPAKDVQVLDDVTWKFRLGGGEDFVTLQIDS